MCNKNMLMLLICLYTLTVVIAASVQHHEEHHPGTSHHKHDSQQIFGEESKAFDQMSLEDKRKKLSAIVDKIDVNNDGFIITDEIKDYIQIVQKKYIIDDVKRHWEHLEATEPLNFTFYIYKIYGVNLSESDDIKEYKDMIERDQKRWNGADSDKNGLLSREEFTVFVHPEDHPHMKHIVLEESFNDMDKDKDGKITVKEYIEDMYVSDGKEEPDWVIEERNHFHEFRDLNKDGTLDMTELANWLMPDNYDNAEAEAMHLVRESDSDKDGKLSKDEIIENIEIFAGSQVTDYGNSFNTPDHDEL